MAGERVKLEVAPRQESGTSAARRLRREGKIPGVLYGRGNPPRPICVAERELRRVLTGAGGLHAILDVALEGQSTTHASILKDYQQDPLRGKIVHFDLQEVRLDQPIHAAVSVHLMGEPVGSREGGVLSQVSREINVEALPMEIPEHLELDVSGMHINDTMRVADLPPVAGVTYLDDPEGTVLANVTPPTIVVEPEVEEELEEGAEVPEGEEAPEAEAEAEAGAGESGEPETAPE